jgi:replicative DNA helicase
MIDVPTTGNDALEASVIGQVLRGHAADVMTATEVLTSPVCFHLPVHRAIWHAVITLDRQHRAVTVVDVVTQLDTISHDWFVAHCRDLEQPRERARAGLARPPRPGESSVLAAIGGLPAIQQTATLVHLPQLFRHHVAAIQDAVSKRLLVERMRDVALRSAGSSTSSELLDELAGIITSTPAVGGAQVADAEEVAKRFIAAAPSNDPLADAVVEMGHPGFESVIPRLRPGSLTILAARPGAGKTSLALGTAMATAKASQRVLFISLEMPSDQLVGKMLACDLNMNYRDVERGTADERAAWIARARSWLSHIDFADQHDLSVDGMRSLIRRRCAGPQRPDLIIIDYLQLLSRRPGQTEYEGISEASRACKVTGLDVRVPILCLSQLSRDGEKGQAGARPPRLSDLRGSGSIEQDADAVIFLHAHLDQTRREGSEEHRLVEAIVAKNRFGSANTSIWLRWHMGPMIFSAGEEPQAAEESGDATAERKLRLSLEGKLRRGQSAHGAAQAPRRTVVSGAERAQPREQLLSLIHI